MPPINKDNPSYLTPFVCIDCRRSFKRPQQDSVAHRPCPLCGQPAICLSQKFKPPRSSDRAGWEKVRLLVEHGFRFESIYGMDGGEVPYPKTLKEALAWLQRW